ncbi:hypothetical protein [Rhodosalinus sediminis]|uniref:hypothetical protein n=1 Tax=Rhodosalinus sediminis TaxID=1940533 RepID=UPI002357BE46|nr:hypothetical protein [Rhodosalinus sediminis]
MSALGIIFRRVLGAVRAPADAAAEAPTGEARPALRLGPSRAARRRAALGAADLPVRDVTRDEHDAKSYHGQGLFLARQDRWDELDALIRETDAARAATPGGELVAELLARGAVADALEPGPDGATAPGLAWLHDLRAEAADQPGLALAVAWAEIATAEAARDGAAPADLPVERRMDYHSHLAQAAHVLEDFDPIALDSPAIAAAHCVLAPVWQADAAHLTDLYEDLIDLDPANPRHMRALGRALRARGLGALPVLERAARDTAERTADIWGAGGYTWCWRDALLADPRGFERVDSAHLLRGIEDILLRHEDQHLLNQLAAFCVLAPDRRAGAADTGAIAARRAAVREAGQHILRTQMSEIHPVVWAETAGHTGDRMSAMETGERLARAALDEAAGLMQAG